MQLRDFDLNLLVIMESIGTTHSVSVAAKRLNLAQSTISAALNRLRQQLGDPIFVWNGHEMVPTTVGSQLLPQVARILEGVRGVIEQAHGDRADVERRLVIATVDYVVALYGPELIRRGEVEAPNTVLDFVGIRPQAVDRNSLPDIDFFICPLNAHLRVGGLKHEPLYTDEYVCIAARENHRLHPDITPDEFLRLPHIGYSAVPRATLNHESMLWSNLETEPRYRMTMANYLVFPRIVAHSDAVAILPRRLVDTIRDDWPIKVITPPVPLPKLEVSQVWRPNRNADPAIGWLRKSLLEITRSFG